MTRVSPETETVVGDMRPSKYTEQNPDSKTWTAGIDVFRQYDYCDAAWHLSAIEFHHKDESQAIALRDKAYAALCSDGHAQTAQVRQQEKRWVVKMSWQDGETPASCQMDETGSLEDAKAKVRHYAAAFGWKPEMGAKFEIGSYDWPHYVTATPTAVSDTSTDRGSK